MKLFSHRFQKKTVLSRAGVAAPSCLVERADGLVLAYGLAWYALDGLGSRSAQARKLAQLHRAGLYTVVHPRSAGVEPVVGILAKMYRPRLARPVQSAAACFSAAVQQDAALYLAPGPTTGTYLLVGVLLGLPSPEFDVVGDARAVSRVADQFEGYLTEGVVCYVDQALVKALGSGRLDACLEAFITRNRAAVQSVATMPCSPVTGLETGGVLTAPASRAWMLPVVSGMVLAGVAAAFYVLQDEASRLEEETAKKTSAALTAYRSAQSAAFRSAGTQVAVKAVPAIWDSVREYKLVRNGWLATSVACASGACEAIYERSVEGTFEAFLETTTATESAQLSLGKLNTASLRFQTPGWSEIPELNLATVTQEDVTVAFGSQVQRMALAGLSLAVTPPVPLLSDAGPGGQAAPVERYGVGQWQVTGPADTLLAAVKRLPESATLTSLKFQVADEGVTYVALGRYFVLLR